jgi:predicted nucleotidyltransferase
MIDVAPEHLEILLALLSKYLPDCEARVFGSRFSGTAKSYSDLDLAVVGQNTLDWRVLAELKEAFQESELPFRVDMLDWNAISNEFRTVIEKSGYEVISGKENSAGKR